MSLVSCRVVCTATAMDRMKSHTIEATRTLKLCTHLCVCLQNAMQQQYPAYLRCRTYNVQDTHTTHTISELRQLAVEHTHKSLCAAVQTNSSVHKSFYFLLVLHIVIGRWLVGSSDPNLVTYYASASQFWQTDAQRRFPRCTSPYVVYAYVCVL